MNISENRVVTHRDAVQHMGNTTVRDRPEALPALCMHAKPLSLTLSMTPFQGTAPSDVSDFKQGTDEMLNGLFGKDSVPPVTIAKGSLPPGLFPYSPEFAGRAVTFSK